MLRLLLHGYGQFDARHPVRPVFWPHFDLLFVHRGTLELTVGESAAFRLTAGAGVLIYPHTTFSGHAIGRLVRASVQHFAIEGIGPQDNRVLARMVGRERGFTPLPADGGPQLVADVERALELATRPPDEVIAALRVAQLTLLLGGILAREQPLSAKPAGAENLHQVLAWARTKSGAVSAGELAKRSGYSYGEFRELFGKTFSGRPARYLLRLRVNEAKRLLRESRMAMKEIAQEVGYGDVVAFHRAFAREVGRTPGDYRRRFSPQG